MTLAERVNATDWSDEDMAWFKRHVESAAFDPVSRDLLLAVTAAIIGHDDACLMTLHNRTRELVDLAVLMQAERAASSVARPVRPAGSPRLSVVVGGRDV